MQTKDTDSIRFDITARGLVVKDNGGRLYHWGTAVDKDDPSQRKLSGLAETSTGDDTWVIFYVEDCFSPPMFLINGDSFEDCYEEFCTAFEHMIKIEEPDLKDYDPETLNYNDNGTPIDTESVQGFKVQLVSAIV